MERVILITGASRGIGAATARLAAKRGAAVAISYLANVDAAQEVVTEIEGAVWSLPVGAALDQPSIR